MNQESSTQTNRCICKAPETGFKVNAREYPIITSMVFLTLVMSMMCVSKVFFEVLMESDEPPFKIEIKTNSSSEAALNQTVLNQTELHRQFNKILFTYLTSAGSDEDSAPSYKMNLKNGKPYTGIALAVVFLLFVIGFICGVAVYGIREADPKLIMPFHIYWYIFTFMTTALSFVVPAAMDEKKRKEDPEFFNVPLGNIGWLCLVLLAFAVLLFIGLLIDIELEDMGIIKKHFKTPHHSVPEATSRV